MPACVAIEGHSSFDFSKIETYVDGKLVRGHLLASPRQSVCTYKGEAIYYHVKVGEQMAKNAVWSYRKPWLDFSIDVGNIAGLLAFYTTAFDRILLDGKPIVMDEHTRATDTHMLASPTIDQTLAANMQPKPA